LDHRLIDGVAGAQFIDALVERIERDPRSTG
jgi:pyruvate/2-oxoglutarate dehydrogenase complex dihydrolipoamide acyltransferase (E2) component